MHKEQKKNKPNTPMEQITIIDGFCLWFKKGKKMIDVIMFLNGIKTYTKHHHEKLFYIFFV